MFRMAILTERKDTQLPKLEITVLTAQAQNDRKMKIFRFFHVHLNAWKKEHATESKNYSPERLRKAGKSRVANPMVSTNTRCLEIDCNLLFVLP